MIIQVVAGQIGEGAGGDTHAVEPALVKTVARCLKRQMIDAKIRQMGQVRVQIGRVGRGQPFAA